MKKLIFFIIILLIVYIIRFYFTVNYNVDGIYNIQGDIFLKILPKEKALTLTSSGVKTKNNVHQERKKTIIVDAPFKLTLTESGLKETPLTYIDIGYFYKIPNIGWFIKDPLLLKYARNYGYDCWCIYKDPPYPSCVVYSQIGNYQTVIRFDFRKNVCNESKPNDGFENIMTNISTNLDKNMYDYLENYRVK